MTLDLKELAVTITDWLAWLSVIGVFITVIPEVFLVSAVLLFWLSSYVGGCKRIPTLTIRFDRF